MKNSKIIIASLVVLGLVFLSLIVVSIMTISKNLTKNNLNNATQQGTPAVNNNQATQQGTPAVKDNNATQEQSECEKAGGKLSTVTECDGSLSPWCVLSENEYCYVEQIVDNKCPKNLSARVQCDKDNKKIDIASSSVPACAMIGEKIGSSEMQKECCPGLTPQLLSQDGAEAGISECR